MTDSSFPTNQPSVVVDNAIDGIFKAAVKAAETALLAVDPPITANPIIAKIDNEVIEIVSRMVYKQFAEWVTFDIVIPIEIHGEVSDEKKALIALKAAQKEGNQDAIAQALATFQKAVGGLTHVDGSGPV